MAKFGDFGGKQRRLGATRVLRRLGGCLLLGFGLAACSTPDWADPDEWFGTETADPEQVPAEGFDEDADYPNLSSVPEAPPRPSPDEQRAALAEGLISDHGNARYSGQILTAESTAVPEAGPPVPVPAAQPTPPPAEPAPPPAEPAPPLVASVGTVDQADTGAGDFFAPQQAALAPAADLSGAGTLVAVLYFEAGATTLDPADRALLMDIVALQRQRGGELRVVGHESGAAAGRGLDGEVDSFELSLGRANAVADAMVELGLPLERLRVMAASDSQPIYDESQATGAAGNRRVEVFLR